MVGAALSMINSLHKLVDANLDLQGCTWTGRNFISHEAGHAQACWRGRTRTNGLTTWSLRTGDSGVISIVDPWIAALRRCDGLL
jgi:hypothetical protein